ncbi:cytochrome P450 [Apodospora peruviana]|uniref:Cytochrome P450 n=1 Tax=Apodospora peruviana TaxID=516989 RepID=A0AAE0IRU0_9PEZI|nr:cytochrome P450 [Apodospora peruviana]
MEAPRGLGLGIRLGGVSTWQSVAVVVVVYLVTLAFYRLFLHPIAHFPGPKLAAVTRYYEAYYDVVKDGQYTFKIAEMHKKYGPIVRISPYELHVSDPTYYEKLFRHEGRWNKYWWAIDAHNAPGAIIFTADHDRHKQHRQPLNAYFSKATVARRQDLIRAKVDKLCQRLAAVAGTGRVVDVGAAMSAFSGDVSTEYVLGKSADNLSRDDFGSSITHFMQGGGKMWRWTKHMRWYGPLMLSIPKDFLIKNGDEKTATFMRWAKSNEEETARLLEVAASSDGANSRSERTIVHEIVDSNLPPEDKTLTRVFSDVVTVTGAGFETTASVLRLVLYHVYTNSKMLARLRAELAGVSSVPNEVVQGLRTVEQLPYLTAVLMEGMRMSPALGTRLQRIAPDRDLVYDGRWRIPAGTPVGMTTLFMHMDEKLYKNPRTFDPERWVDPEARKAAEKIYAPFSRGSRICLGMHLAWAELYLSVSALVKQFDFDFEGLTPDHLEFESDQFIIGTKGKAVLEATVTAYKS